MKPEESWGTLRLGLHRPNCLEHKRISLYNIIVCIIIFCCRIDHFWCFRIFCNNHLLYYSMFCCLIIQQTTSPVLIANVNFGSKKFGLPPWRRSKGDRPSLTGFFVIETKRPTLWGRRVVKNWLIWYCIFFYQSSKLGCFLEPWLMYNHSKAEKGTCQSFGLNQCPHRWNTGASRKETHLDRPHKKHQNLKWSLTAGLIIWSQIYNKHLGTKTLIPKKRNKHLGKEKPWNSIDIGLVDSSIFPSLQKGSQPFCGLWPRNQPENNLKNVQDLKPKLNATVKPMASQSVSKPLPMAGLNFTRSPLEAAVIQSLEAASLIKNSRSPSVDFWKCFNTQIWSWCCKITVFGRLKGLKKNKQTFTNSVAWSSSTSSRSTGDGVKGSLGLVRFFGLKGTVRCHHWDPAQQ